RARRRVPRPRGRPHRGLHPARRADLRVAPRRGLQHVRRGRAVPRPRLRRRPPGARSRMKRVSYAGGEFLTGDLIPDALLDYAAALARAGQADHVAAPGIGGDDRVTRFDLVVGPASQLIAESLEVAGEELEAEEFVAELELRGRRARAGRVGEPGAEDA